MPFKAVYDMAIPVEQFDLVHFLASLEWGSRGLSALPGKLWFGNIKLSLSQGKWAEFILSKIKRFGSKQQFWAEQICKYLNRTDEH